MILVTYMFTVEEFEELRQQAIAQGEIEGETNDTFAYRLTNEVIKKLKLKFIKKY